MFSIYESLGTQHVLWRTHRDPLKTKNCSLNALGVCTLFTGCFTCCNRTVWHLLVDLILGSLEPILHLNRETWSRLMNRRDSGSKVYTLYNKGLHTLQLLYWMGTDWVFTLFDYLRYVQVIILWVTIYYIKPNMYDILKSFLS